MNISSTSFLFDFGFRIQNEKYAELGSRADCDIAPSNVIPIDST